MHESLVFGFYKAPHANRKNRTGCDFICELQTIVALRKIASLTLLLRSKRRRCSVPHFKIVRSIQEIGFQRFQPVTLKMTGWKPIPRRAAPCLTQRGVC